MFNLSGRYQAHLYQVAVDGRWGFDRLAGLCKSVMGCDPFSGDLFLFFNKNKTRCRLIFYDMSTCYIVSGRLEVGTFKISWDQKQKHLELRMSDLLTLLAGGELVKSGPKHPGWLPTIDQEY